MDRESPADHKPVRAGRGSSVALQRAAFLFAGVAIGAIVVLATLRFVQPPPPAAQLDRQPSFVASGALAPKSPPTDPKPKTEEAKPQALPDKPSGGPEVQPYNPFTGPISAMPPREITGTAPAPGPAPQGVRGGVPVSTSDGTEEPATEPQAPRGLLVTVRMDVGDPDSAVGALQGLAGRMGGSAIRYDESAVKPDPEGAILFVPAAKAEETQKALTSVGSVIASDRWNGASGDRIDRVEAAAQNRLSELNLKRQELLVKYFEDAPQIRHIDEDSERIRKSMSAFRGRKPGPATAVFKVVFTR